MELHTNIPLCVDLDGTLSKSDLTFESIVTLLRKNPVNLLLFPLWILRGRPFFKQKVAQKVDLAVSLLPYNQSVVGHLKKEKSNGRKIILVTGSHVSFGKSVANHLRFFDTVIGSDSTNNMTGKSKAKYLINTFGEKGFDYAGNSMVDLPVWMAARHAIVVNATPSTIKQARKKSHVTLELGQAKTPIKVLLKAIRIHQWSKNALLFVPLLMAHKINDMTALVITLMGFFAFSLCASGMYLINDIFDLKTDRIHVQKKHRSLACGDMSFTEALIASILFLGLSFYIALALPRDFVFILLLYFVINCAYSLFLKTVALIDVITLAGLYTIRLFAGSHAADIELSFWLLAFSIFIFLSLALVKRCSELMELKQGHKESNQRRDYLASDLEQLSRFGSSSGYLSVIILALYINSDHVANIYQHPERLWILCPLLLYWISRIWLLTSRGKIDLDPVLFALKDKQSYFIGLIAVIILFFAGVQ